MRQFTDIGHQVGQLQLGELGRQLGILETLLNQEIHQLLQRRGPARPIGPLFLLGELQAQIGRQGRGQAQVAVVLQVQLTGAEDGEAEAVGLQGLADPLALGQRGIEAADEAPRGLNQPGRSGTNEPDILFGKPQRSNFPMTCETRLSEIVGQRGAFARPTGLVDMTYTCGMRYHRAKTPGATYFFTLVTYQRRPFLCDPEQIDLLHSAFRTVKRKHPFSIDALVLLPDHLHCLWTLPPDDCDYSTRWMLIKAYFTRRCSPAVKSKRSTALHRKRLQPVWQQRFWEHQIRDDRDLEQHCDYIHYNPVKHSLANRVVDWSWSSFHHFVRDGSYPSDWAGCKDLIKGVGGYGE